MLAVLLALSLSSPAVVEEARRLRRLMAADPAAAADRAYSAGDRRLWAVRGLGYSIPGTSYSNLRPQPRGGCGEKMLPLLSDVMFPETRELYRPAERWAAAYNYRMVVRSGCLPASADLRSPSFQAELAELRRLLAADPIREAERAVAAGERRLWRRHGETKPIGHITADGSGEPCRLRPMPGLHPVFSGGGSRPRRLERDVRLAARLQPASHPAHRLQLAAAGRPQP